MAVDGCAGRVLGADESEEDKKQEAEERRVWKEKSRQAHYDFFVARVVLEGQ